MKYSFALLLWVSCSLFNGKSYSQEIARYFDFSPEMGGYGVGSFVVIKKKNISTPLIRRETLEKDLPNPEVIRVSELDPPPQIQQTVNKTRVFKENISLDSAYRDIDFETKSELIRVMKVNLIVEDARRYAFDLGSEAAIQRVIKCIPKNDLELIESSYKSNKNIYIITEVVEYSKAKAVYEWSKEVNVDLQSKIAKIVTVNGNATWNSNKSLTINYNRPVKVKFKCYKLSSTFLKLVLQEIQNRIDNSCPCCPPPVPPLILSYGRCIFDTHGDNKEGGLVTVEVWQSGKLIFGTTFQPEEHWKDPSNKQYDFVINKEVKRDVPMSVKIRLCDGKEVNIRWMFNVVIEIFKSDSSRFTFSKNNVVLNTTGRGRPLCDERNFD